MIFLTAEIRSLRPLINKSFMNRVDEPFTTWIFYRKREFVVSPPSPVNASQLLRSKVTIEFYFLYGDRILEKSMNDTEGVVIVIF